MDMSEMLRGVLAPASRGVTLDAAGDSASAADAYTIADIRMAAVSSLREWADTDNLDEGESYADRLLAMMVGIADENKDGEVTDDEQDVLDVALNSAFDYLVSKGVDEKDASALIDDWSDDAAERVHDLLANDETTDDEADSFVFSDADQAPALDAVYRKRIVIRGGKKVRINKRVSGTVRLSAAQKAGIRKARMRAHSAGARIHRMKSMRLRRKSNL